tara:strand:- start:259 stop:1173 length:915 start_codon:yes stop_codon:yes gene_type:complete
MKTIYDLEKIFRDIQSYIRLKFEQFETSNNINISSDEWERPEGGGGITHVIADGEVFDNCAINFSSIYGKELPNSALAKSLDINLKNSYQAMGISVIAHPKNPHIPTSHMNVRLFCMLNENNDIQDWWIGGGYDLTPFIPYEKDVIEWHKNAKALLQPYGDNLYKEFSENCNSYFNIPHRKERRGVGGIFFDNLKNFNSIQDAADFLQKLAVSYTTSYSNIVDKRKDSKFDDIQKDFQLIRRGRYVEFNLVYDRGTSFGLQSNGRIESIMASLPACVKWSYKKSDEYKLLERSLLKFINRDWNV